MTSLGYYGLSLNSPNLGVSVYVSFAISGGIELPSYIFVFLTLNRIGRRPIIAGLFFLGAVALLLTMAVPEGCLLGILDRVGDVPDSKVHGAYMGPTWGRQDPGGPHVCPMIIAIWGVSQKQVSRARKKLHPTISVGCKNVTLPLTYQKGVSRAWTSNYTKNICRIYLLVPALNLHLGKKSQILSEEIVVLHQGIKYINFRSGAYVWKWCLQTDVF